MMSAKKNVTLRAAAVLFALALITSCFVGGTFAKYVTTGNGSDTARVAKFGVKVEANGTMFAEEYATDDENAQATIVKSVISSGKSDVEGAPKDNVVAPGTSGNMGSVKLTGKPEVAVSVTYAPTVELNDGWVDADGKFYCPLQITIGTATIDGHKFNDKGQFVAAIESEIRAHNRKYEPNTDLKTFSYVYDTDLNLSRNPSIDISWAWPFEATTNDNLDHDAAAKEIAANNVKDTYLGDQAAAGHPATISIEVVATVSQVD